MKKLLLCAGAVSLIALAACTNTAKVETTASTTEVKVEETKIEETKVVETTKAETKSESKSTNEFAFSFANL